MFFVFLILQAVCDVLLPDLHPVRLGQDQNNATGRQLQVIIAPFAVAGSLAFHMRNCIALFLGKKTTIIG